LTFYFKEFLVTLHLFQVGINNYPGTGSDLAGCLNDLKDFRALLPAKLGTHVVLKDSQALKAKILQGLRDFVLKLQAGDWGIVQYSGHGSWEPDLNADEPDSRDECWVPYDWANGVLDDELAKLWQLLKPKAKLLLLTDSCMNGTVFRLRPSFHATADRRTRVRFLSPEQRLGSGSRKTLKSAERVAAAPMPDKKEAVLPNVIHWAGSLNTEYCSDAVFRGRPNGAFTRLLIDLRKSLAQPTFQQLQTALRNHLPSGDYPQTPVLNATAANKKLPIPF